MLHIWSLTCVKYWFLIGYNEALVDYINFSHFFLVAQKEI